MSQKSQKRPHPSFDDSFQRPQPAGAGRPLVAFRRDLADGAVIPWHKHAHAQLIYGGSGLMRIESSVGAWVAPPARAVWIPAGIEHQVTCVGRVAMQVVYVLPEAAPWLPGDCQVVAVSPLLRELVAAAMEIKAGYDLDGPEARLVAVLIDSLRARPVEELHLPMPADRRLRAVTRELVADPGDPRTLADFALDAGASARTLARLFVAETGLSFGAWRQQLRLHEALARLASGEPVTSVAYTVGYDSPSAFIAMFRKALGDTPGRYLGRG